MMQTPHTEVPNASGSSPWGGVDYAYLYPEGIRCVGTPGHGGWWVPCKLNRRIPGPLRNDTRANNAPDTTAGGWYEEDCEWAVPVYCLPDLFHPDDVTEARRVLRSWFPDEFTAAFPDDPVAVKESHILQERAALEAIPEDGWVTTAAFGSWADWVPDGMVGVCANRRFELRRSGAEQAWFLVPKAEYDQRQWYFYVDTERHERLADDPTRPSTERIA